MARLKEEVGNLQAASDGLLQDRDEAADSCGRLSSAFLQQEVQLRAREQELEGLREATRIKAEGLCRQTAELDSLKTDRHRLIQDLKDQAMAVDNLQLELDGVSEELDRRRGAEESLQEALKQEQTRTSQLRSRLDEEREEVCRLSQENGSYTRLADQLSTQIVEMEEEISTLRDHLRELSSQLNGTADLVLDLRRQLNSKTSEVDRLRAEVAEAKASSEKHRSDAEQLDRAREQVLQLQQVLQDSQNQLRTAEEDFHQEKRKMMQQLMELEKLVLALEEEMDPASPHRFVEHETARRPETWSA